MKISVYRQKLRDAFFKRLEQKTGWGKELVKKEFEEAGEQVLLEMLEEAEEKLPSGPCKNCGGKDFNRTASGSLECTFCHELYR